MFKVTREMFHQEMAEAVFAHLRDFLLSPVSHSYYEAHELEAQFDYGCFGSWDGRLPLRHSSCFAGSRFGHKAPKPGSSCSRVGSQRRGWQAREALGLQR